MLASIMKISFYAYLFEEKKFIISLPLLKSFDYALFLMVFLPK